MRGRCPRSTLRTVTEPDPTFIRGARRFDAVVCDIDGCLGPESAAPVDAEGLARLAAHNRAAQSLGDRPVVTICSGRPQPYAEAICRMIHNDTLPIVCENGVWLWDPRDNSYTRDPAIRPEHAGAVAEVSRWIESELGPKGVVIQPGKHAAISIWHADTAFLFGLIPMLRETFAARSWPFRVSTTVAWINIDLTHVSKATGLRRFIERTRLRKERLAGIGDSPSDLAMLEHCAFFACPANAAAEVRARAHYVSPREEIDGVLDILERLG